MKKLAGLLAVIAFGLVAGSMATAADESAITPTNRIDPQVDAKKQPIWATIDRQVAADESVITPTNRIDLFDGASFNGWKLFLPKNTDVTKTWSIENGVIHNTGEPVGYMRTDQAYRDYKLTVEWRFLKVTPGHDNTGILVHMADVPDKLWPECVQCQGQSQKQGDLIFMTGAAANESKDLPGANKVLAKPGPSNEKPVGEWDTVEVLCAGDGIKAWVNGKLMNEATGCNITSGRIGIQSEHGDIEIRKIYLDPLPK
jgi:hypothetical protein